MFNIKSSENSHGASKKRGFSLVEMLVAIGIFMSIMVIAISSLISIIDADKRTQAIKNTIDSVTFAVEDISRDMRIGYGYQCSMDNSTFSTGCLDASGNNVGGTAVRYTNSAGNTITYTFNGKSDPSKGVLTKLDAGCPTKPLCAPVDLISQDSNVSITDMKFYVIGADHEFDTGSTKTQPRVVITASGLISSKGATDTSFNLQTNISQRIRR